ncbi:hypothetical protein CD116_09900 [Staphylococcus schweitzeri]|uniref:Uncharacterized protein n=1 Tax=Staphylococcus schweitzeri TaxID=1654388 RepID=A0A2K4AFU4_9STAP|nr:hypothetical protein CD116_09900 [Staphylococcus schweitzeri]
MKNKTIKWESDIVNCLKKWYILIVKKITLISMFCKMLSITKCYSQNMILMKQLHYYFMERRVSLC